MPYPYDGIPRAGLDVPGMVCPECKRVGVYWMSGKNWMLDVAPPHFQCNQCGESFAAPPPVTSKLHAMKQEAKRLSVWRLP